MEKGYRHEYKYLISKADAELLKRRLPHIMERDPHAGETGRYTIRSLYFDDFNNTAYYDKTDGVNYHFISRENFLDMVRKGEFLEYDEHHDNLYGTLYSAVKDATEKGHVVLDIEPNGAMNVRRKYPDAILIFIMPPSWEALETRLRGRGDTPEEQVQTRLIRARWEIDQADKYDYQVVNDQVETCVAEVLKIIADKAD